MSNTKLSFKQRFYWLLEDIFLDEYDGELKLFWENTFAAIVLIILAFGYFAFF